MWYFVGSSRGQKICHRKITAETTVKLAPIVPSQKRKEEAKKTLYLNRI
jgi:hypothetical protein